jgi:hypothetical protein
MRYGALSVMDPLCMCHRAQGAQPGALGLADLTKIARHETKVKLLAVIALLEQHARVADYLRRVAAGVGAGGVADFFNVVE